MTLALEIILGWSEKMQDFATNFRYVLRNMWRYWEVYVYFALFVIVVTAIIGGPFKQAIIHKLENQIEVIKYQNERSIEDRSYLHKELENTRSSLKRLEVKAKTNE
jgi:uncharacterized protein involved in cysteine biosynthesis